MASPSTTVDTTDCSSLPNELWEAIGGYLIGDRFNVTRFRSVCSSWRSSIPKFDHSETPPLPRFSFPVPHSPTVHTFVSDSSVYRIDRPSAAAGSWLVKVEFSGGNKIRLLDALSCRRIQDVQVAIASPEPFRLSEFRISETLARTYALRMVRGSLSIAGVNKLVLNPGDSNSVFVIYDNGKLGFARDGDKDLTPVDNRIRDYNDIIVHRGQPYVVDRWGTVSWIDSSLKLVQFSPPIGPGGRKHLVVFSGELYVVDRYIDENSASSQYADEGLRDAYNLLLHNPLRRRRFDHIHSRTVDFKVFKLDDEWGRWAEVKSLGENSLVLTYDCSFSIAAAEFEGFEANCIYFTEQFELDNALRRLGRQGGSVFRLEDGTIEELPITPGYFSLFFHECVDHM